MKPVRKKFCGNRQGDRKQNRPLRSGTPRDASRGTAAGREQPMQAARKSVPATRTAQASDAGIFGAATGTTAEVTAAPNACGPSAAAVSATPGVHATGDANFTSAFGEACTSSGASSGVSPASSASPAVFTGSPADAPVQELCVDERQAGLRLDHALECLLPHMGLRGRKRCIENGGVSVNGRAASASRRMRLGDVVRLHPAAVRESPVVLCDGFSGTLSSSSSSSPSSLADAEASSSSSLSSPPPSSGVLTASGLRMLGRQGEYCFFSKPAQMHSAALAGVAGVSVEALMPALVTQWAKEQGRGSTDFDPAKLALLQRLDFGTSGLLCAALSTLAADGFRAAEAAGQCEKRYVALLSGELSGPVVARQELDVSARRKSRLRSGLAHHTRWTEFWPLHVWKAADPSVRTLQALSCSVRSQGAKAESGACAAKSGAGEPFPTSGLPFLAAGLTVPASGLTLAACRIRRGARHQIRAHAAGLGHALWGDSLYGGAEEYGGPDGCLSPVLSGGHPAAGNTAWRPAFCSLPHAAGFFLHHGGLRLPGAAVTDDPPWPLPDTLMQLVRAWLAGVLPGGAPWLQGC